MNNTEYPLRERARQNQPSWAEDIMQPWDDHGFSEKEGFITSHYWTGQGSVNVFNVVGTIHPDYQRKSWINLLENGKRMNQNLPLLESNPSYYHDTVIKQPNMYFKTVDGTNFFIGDDGNHRTCIARFYFYEQGMTQLHGVNINHYQIDEVFYSVYQSLLAEIERLKLRVYLKPKKTLTRRDDTAGWKTDYFQTELIWRENDSELLLSRSDAEQKLLALKQKGNGIFSLLRKLSFR